MVPFVYPGEIEMKLPSTVPGLQEENQAAFIRIANSDIIPVISPLPLRMAGLAKIKLTGWSVLCWVVLYW
jgi:hypothetical protein